MTTLPTELTLLVWSVVLTFVMILTGSMLRGRGWTPAGMIDLFGNRENVPYAQEGLAGRADRAWRNMLENLVMFSSLVLTAQVAGISTGNTVLGAQLFFWARLAYFPVYLAGIPYLRTAIWTVGSIGMALIALELL